MSVDRTSRSDATADECHSLQGKTIEHVEASEYSFKLMFTDGAFLEIRGHSHEDSALSVEVSG